MRKSLKFKFDLKSRFAVYVPSTDNVSEKIDNTAQVEKVLHDLSELFGGATATPAFGAWNCANGSVVIESVTICYAFCTTEQAENNFEKVLDICQWIKTTMHQEAVSLEYNGQLAFV